MPITARAGGKEFRFPDGTTPEQMGEAIDSYFAQKNPSVLTKAVNTAIQREPAASGDQVASLTDVAQDIASDMNIGKQALVSLGRGFSNVLSGVEQLGLKAESVFRPEALAELESLKAQQDRESQIFDGLKQESPVIGTTGELVGEIGALAPVGLAQAGLTAGRGLLGRLAIGAGAGATEAAALSGGDIGDIGTGAGIGASIEAASPLAGKLYKGVKNAGARAFGSNVPINELIEEVAEDGKRVIKPTEKGRQALSQFNVRFEDLNEQAVDSLASLPKGADPAQSARKALFDDLGIKTVRSRITQSPEDFAQEQMLRRSTQTPQGAGMGEALAEESAGFRDKLIDVAENLGEAEDSGALINAALDSRKKGLKRLEKRAYTALDELSKGKPIRLPTKPINEVFETSLLKRLKRQDEPTFNRIQDLSVEFGINKNPDLVSKFVDDVTPLSISNQETFRQSLNQLIKNDGSIGDAAAKSMIRALDSQVDRTDAFLKSDAALDALGDKGVDSRAIIKQARKARSIAARVRDEFNPKKLAARLIDSKRGDLNSRLIENSEISKKLLSPSTSMESLETTANLLGGSAKGRKALGALQARTVLQLLNDATSSQSAKLAGGVIDFSPVKFSNALNKIGRNKLDVIFKTNPNALKDIQRLEEAAKLKTPFTDAVMKSNTFPDLWNKMREGFGGVIKAGSALTPLSGALDAIAKGSANKRATREAFESLKTATDTSPAVKEASELLRVDFSRSYPALATQLGVISATNEELE